MKKGRKRRNQEERNELWDQARVYYLEGLTADSTQKKLHLSDYKGVLSFFNAIRLTREEYAQLLKNKEALHKRYERLRSHRSAKEYRLEKISYILARRIRKHERRMLMGG